MKNRILLVSVAAFLSGCVLPAPPPRNSRFEADLTRMQKSDLMNDTWIFRHPTLRVRDYDNFNLVSMEVFPTPAKKLSPESVARYDQLAARCEAQLKAMIAKGPASPAAGGTKVLDLKVAIIDIKPVVHLKKANTDIISTNPDIKGSKFEMDCFDHKTGELIFAISSLLKGDEFAAFEDPALAPRLDKYFVNWVGFLEKRLAESRQEK